MTRSPRLRVVTFASAAGLVICSGDVSPGVQASEFMHRRGDDSWSSTSTLGKPGCSAPVGEKWDRWDMAGSTYNYCYAGCHMDWLLDNSNKYNLSAYAGTLPVARYFTKPTCPSMLSAHTCTADSLLLWVGTARCCWRGSLLDRARCAVWNRWAAARVCHARCAREEVEGSISWRHAIPVLSYNICRAVRRRHP